MIVFMAFMFLLYILMSISVGLRELQRVKYKNNWQHCSYVIMVSEHSHFI